jgi:protein gp37
MPVEWARDVRDQCRAAGVPLFLKQLGGRRDKGEDPTKWPHDLRVREFPSFTKLSREQLVGRALAPP